MGALPAAVSAREALSTLHTSWLAALSSPGATQHHGTRRPWPPPPNPASSHSCDSKTLRGGRTLNLQRPNRKTRSKKQLKRFCFSRCAHPRGLWAAPQSQTHRAWLRAATPSHLLPIASKPQMCPANNSTTPSHATSTPRGPKGIGRDERRPALAAGAWQSRRDWYRAKAACKRPQGDWQAGLQGRTTLPSRSSLQGPRSGGGRAGVTDIPRWGPQGPVPPG